jgi:hypothetical protein
VQVSLGREGRKREREISLEICFVSTELAWNFSIINGADFSVKQI